MTRMSQSAALRRAADAIPKTAVAERAPGFARDKR